MRRQFLEWYSRFVYEHRVGVLVVASLVTVLAGVACLGLEFRTSRDEMSLGNAPAEVAFDAFLEEFGTPDHLLIVVGPANPGETADPDAYRGFVDDLAERLRGETDYFEDIFFRLDLATLEAQALYYLPLEDLRRLADALRDEALPALGELRDLPDAIRYLAARIRAGLDESADPDDIAGGAESLRELLPALEWQARFLANPAIADSVDLEELARGLAGGRRGLGTIVVIGARPGATAPPCAV